MAAADPPSFPCESASYQMAEALGYGASSVVNRAICLTNNQQVAVKRINLEKSSADIAEIRVRSLCGFAPSSIHARFLSVSRILALSTCLLH
mmetsp:Transcript_12265/g.31110  ORF Transcript_12265/g.31110 Transcript_12265/m.31110 type:complete len:92 (-) Transcript_12265:1496-1771(-)